METLTISEVLNFTKQERRRLRNYLEDLYFHCEGEETNQYIIIQNLQLIEEFIN
jgi:hypothetical protein